MTTAKTVAKHFLDKGFRLLGSGCYAVVFDSKTDPNLVYKIGSTLSDPFLVYAKLQNKFVDNPHYPKIYSIYEDTEHDWYMVKMEALTKLPHHKYEVITRVKKFMRHYDGVVLTKPMEDLVNEISKLLEKHPEIQLDLHNENIMMRGTTPVITDPLSETDIPTNQDTQGWFLEEEVYEH